MGPERYGRVRGHGVGVTPTQMSAVSRYIHDTRDSSSTTNVRRLEVEMEDMRHTHQTEMEDMRRSHQTEIQELRQSHQTEMQSLRAQLDGITSLLHRFIPHQRDTTGLTAENRELKLRLQAMEQQAKLRDALNETLREEVQRLKIATRQLPNINGNCFNGGLQQTVPPYFSHPQQLPHLSGHQAQHHHQPPSHGSSNGQSLSGPSLSDPMDFM